MKGFGVIGGGAVLFAATGLAGSAILPYLGEPVFFSIPGIPWWACLLSIPRIPRWACFFIIPIILMWACLHSIQISTVNRWLHPKYWKDCRICHLYLYQQKIENIINSQEHRDWEDLEWQAWVGRWWQGTLAQPHSAGYTSLAFWVRTPKASQGTPPRSCFECCDVADFYRGLEKNIMKWALKYQKCVEKRQIKVTWSHMTRSQYKGKYLSGRVPKNLTLCRIHEIFF